jgi:hypothetical protein
MDHQTITEQLISLLGEQGVKIRKEAMGGGGGGLCDFKDKQVFFYDVDSSSFETALSCSKAVRQVIGDLESIYLKPAIRDFIDKFSPDE